MPTSLLARTPRALGAPLLAALLAGPAAAQSGPFADGELLVRAPGPVGGDFKALYRIDALTGHGEMVVDGLYPGYSNADWVAYDPYRDLLLAYTAYMPLGTFSPRLYAFDEDDNLTSLGFDGERLGALTPVGDGRVYCTRDLDPCLIDAGDNLTPLLDAGGLPVDLPLEYLAYDAPSNSLIGVTASNPASPCFAFMHLAVHRLPLNAAGTQLSGPITCTSFNVGAVTFVVGLDPLPDGALLVTLTGVSPSSDNVLLRLDPATLGVTVWSTSTLNDVDGGGWCPGLMRAVVLDDAANLLRTFAPGQGGTGRTLPVDVPVGSGTVGVSTANSFADIELFGAPCDGVSQAFGAGLAGKGGFVPVLSASTCPTLGVPLKLIVSDGLGAGVGLIALAANTSSYPLFGGTGYVLPPFVAQLPVVLGGLLGQAGQGSIILSIPTPSTPSLLGVPFYAQGGVLDAAAAAGVALTQALELRLG